MYLGISEAKKSRSLRYSPALLKRIVAMALVLSFFLPSGFPSSSSASVYCPAKNTFLTILMTLVIEV
jgi:hypothetical protein